MKICIQVLLVAALCVPMLGFAQAYKCKQANGTISFQADPCESGPSTMIRLPSSPPPMDAAGDAKGRTTKQPKAHPGEAQQAAQKSRVDRAWQKQDEEIRAYNERVQADNKAIRCNAARQQLGVAQTQRPIYSNDNSGNRKYVEDSDRAAVIASAQARVAAECH